MNSLWVTLAGLEDFDPTRNYFEALPSPISDKSNTSSEDESREIQRHTAFVQDALEFRDDVYWANYIHSNSEARKLERTLQARHANLKMERRAHELTPPNTKKRQSTIQLTHSSPRKKGRITERSPTLEQTPSKLAADCSAHGTAVLKSIEAEDNTADTLDFLGNTKTRHKPSRTDSRHNSDDDDGDEDEDEEAEDAKLIAIRERNIQRIQANPPE